MAVREQIAREFVTDVDLVRIANDQSKLFHCTHVSHLKRTCSSISCLVNMVSSHFLRK